MQPEQGASSHLYAHFLPGMGVRGPGAFWGLGKAGSHFFSISVLIIPGNTVLTIELLQKFGEFSLQPSAFLHPCLTALDT